MSRVSHVSRQQTYRERNAAKDRCRHCPARRARKNGKVMKSCSFHLDQEAEYARQKREAKRKAANP